MIRGIGSSRTGMAFEQERVDVVANNIVNLNTDGYKRTVAVGTEFAPMLVKRFDGEAATGKDAPTVGALGNGAQLSAVLPGKTEEALSPEGQPGVTERSNVDLAQEMTDMMTAIRSYQVNQRALQMQDETLEKTVNELGNL